MSRGVSVRGVGVSLPSVVCVQGGGLCPGVSVWGVSVHRCLCLEGSLSGGGGSLSSGVSVWYSLSRGVGCLRPGWSLSRGLCLGVSDLGGLCLGRSLQGESLSWRNQCTGGENITLPQTSYKGKIIFTN